MASTSMSTGGVREQAESPTGAASTPVEMSAIDTTAAPSLPMAAETTETTKTSVQPQPTAETPAVPFILVQQPTIDTTEPPLTRAQTEALGPAVEDIVTPMPTTADPALHINLMLQTGARHPYKIDERYLNSRNAVTKSTAGDFDPKQLTGYKLKELIWQDWRKEWEARPASPSSIRLIMMGKMVDDKKVLADYPFATDRSNVVHMTIKPADFDQDDDAANAKHTGKGSSIRQRDGGESNAGCRCVVS
ncbi:hypothetical protein LTR62_005889 [Meristemomyces frigidus]|uniref:UBL3-like ubiquitin domain-containing protein n=1 Tax=Meristemomyces frigidus TaxID=1508187 RepID=A0AAN7YJP6_9PEZI|nr:hypothetical protein LTR62_005889 [Meristemomyces frigidus]